METAIWLADQMETSPVCGTQDPRLRAGLKMDVRKERKDPYVSRDRFRQARE